MNWEAIGASAELLGALGVIGSLIYVGNQVRASNLASSVAAKLSATNMLASFQDTMLINPRLAVLMVKGREGYEKLSTEDKLLFSTLALKASLLLSAQFFQFQRKVLTEEDWHENRAVAIYWAKSLGYQQWWDAIGNAAFAGGFKDFIELEIEQAKKQPVYATA
jgi:hypothetical protein